MPDKQPAVLRVADIADELGLTTSRIYQMVGEGQIPMTKVAGRLVCPRPAWDAWIAGLSASASASVDGER